MTFRYPRGREQLVRAIDAIRHALSVPAADNFINTRSINARKDNSASQIHSI